MEVINLVYSFSYDDQDDTITWKWVRSGKFTSKSVYEWLTKGEIGGYPRHIWRARIPYKIKIFLWLLEKRAILTKDNMIRRKWIGDRNCYFCTSPETVDHLFFHCHVAKVVWGMVGICLGATNIPGGYLLSKPGCKPGYPMGG